MLLDMVKTIAANKKTILLVIVMTGIVGMVGLEILIACSMADTGTQELKKMTSFSENIFGNMSNVSNMNDTGNGLGRLNFNFSNYDQLISSTKGLNYTSGYALFSTTLGDILNNGDVSIWKEMLN